MNAVFRFCRFPVSSAFQNVCRTLKTSPISASGIKDWGDSSPPPPPSFDTDDAFDAPPRRQTNRFEDEGSDEFREPIRSDEERFGGKPRQRYEGPGSIGRHDDRSGGRPPRTNSARRYGISINRVELLGNAVADPEMIPSRATNRDFASFRMATNQVIRTFSDHVLVINRGVSRARQQEAVDYPTGEYNRDVEEPEEDKFEDLDDLDSPRKREENEMPEKVEDYRLS